MSKISIIIPVYNAELFISRCLESVCKQTLKDIEIICVNDCSSDNTLAILEEYLKKDNRLRVFTNIQNEGPAPSRNKGLNIANGEYIYFIDSDDWIDSDYLEKMLFAIENTNSDIVLNINIMNDYGKTSSLYVHQTFKEVAQEGESIQAVRAILDTPVVIWARLYRKSYLDKNNLRFVNLKACEDFVFHYITHAHTDKIYAFWGSSYHYVIRNESITGQTKVNKNQDLWIMKAYEEIFGYYKEKNLIENSSIKLFNVWPNLTIDTEDKYTFFKDFFIKISTCYFQQNLYNELDNFFINNILNTENYEDYKTKFSPSVTMSFIRRKK